MQDNIQKLKEELEIIAKRMKEYRETGNYDLEAAEHANYNKIVKQINDLEKEELNSEINKLKEELEASAQRMREYRNAGAFDLEAAEHANYNKILSQINEIDGKKEKKVESKEKINWHPKLTPEQIEELMAEGIRPGDNEYTMALWNYGINPNNQDINNPENIKEKINWHPKLTPEQIEELMAEGIRPGDNEYTLALWNYGINPNDQDIKKPEKPEPEPEKPEPEPRKPEPVPGETKINLPVRSFWEIYDATCTQHCGSISRAIHKFANAPLFSMRGEDTLQKALSVVPNILTFIPKIIAKPINFALGTNKKYEEMYENVKGLNLEEFDVLVESSKNAIYKDDRDKDYLSPTFMKQFKVNDLYLDAVQAIYKQRQADRIRYYNESVIEASSRIKELQQKGDSLSIDEQIELATLGRIKDQEEQKGDEIAHKTKLFEQGAREKTSAYRNISGWVLGKYNPDNREFNHKMAQLAKLRREALERGDHAQATILTQEMDDQAISETRIYQVGRNSANTIDRGNTSIREGEPCELLDKGPSTKTRLLLTNLAVGTAIAKAFQISQNHQIIQEQKDEIASVNNTNANLSKTNASTQIDQNLVDEAAKEYANRNVAAAHATGEYGNLDARAMENGGSWTRGLNSHEYRVNDDALHAATSDISNKVNAATPLEGVKISNEYYNKVVSPALDAAKNYSQSHSFDYSGYISSVEKTLGSDAMTRLFEALQNNSAQQINFAATRDLLSGFSQSADLALLTLIGASVVKGEINKSERRMGYIPNENVGREEQEDERV